MQQSDSFLNVLIVGGRANHFTIQLQSSLLQLKEITTNIAEALKWPEVKSPTIRQLCAALFQGEYYRAEIISLNNAGLLIFSLFSRFQMMSSNSTATLYFSKIIVFQLQPYTFLTMAATQFHVIYAKCRSNCIKFRRLPFYVV